MKTVRLVNVLAASIILTAGTTSQAAVMHLSPNGSGQVLVFPYYTANANNQTLISVVNRSDRGKAIKVRFREGRDSRVALEFNLYLSPFDAWTASLFSSPDTGPSTSASLLTEDNSCTSPAIKTNTNLPQLPDGRRYAPFHNFGYTGSNDDAGPDSLNRTLEGHFELIEMGEVVNAQHGSLSAITHDNSGVPSSCQAINNAWIAATGPDAYWVADPNVDMQPPGGGLFGSATIIDPVNGTMMSYNAEAIDAFSNVAQHSSPESTEPTLVSARDAGFPNTVSARVVADGLTVPLVYPASRAIDAVSALFMRNDIWNEFTTSPETNAASELVISFPTKYAYVDQAIVGDTAIPPFVHVFPTQPSASNSGTASESMGFVVYDQEEGGGDNACNDPIVCGPFFPPPIPFAGQKLSWATSVIGINQPNAETNGSRILGSQLAINADAFGLLGISDGWSRVRLFNSGSSNSELALHRTRPDLNGVVWFGLPAVGFMASSHTIGEVTPGVLAVSVRHSPSIRLHRVEV